MKLNKTITIGITDTNECGISISPDVEASLAFQMLGTLALHVLHAYYTVAKTQITTENNAKPNSDKTKLKPKDIDAATLGIKQSMYDAMDNVFSSVLAQFYPDAPRNDITDEAIIKCTNDLIEQRYNALTPAEKKQYHAQYQKMKLALKYKTPSTHSTQTTQEAKV